MRLTKYEIYLNTLSNKAFFEHFSASEFEVFTKLRTMARIQADLKKTRNRKGFKKDNMEQYTGYCSTSATHCKKGHLLSAENRGNLKKGVYSRICRSKYQFSWRKKIA